MTFRWKRTGLWFEIARTAAAFLLTCLISSMNPLFSAWQVLLLPLCLLLGSHMLNCMVKLVSEVTVGPSGMRISRVWLPSQSLEWKDMKSFEVRSFALGSFRKKSLTDMKLRGPAGSIVFDDGLERFSDLLAEVWREARQSGVPISETTRANLVASGFDDARST